MTTFLAERGAPPRSGWKVSGLEPNIDEMKVGPEHCPVLIIKLIKELVHLGICRVRLVN